MPKTNYEKQAEFAADAMDQFWKELRESGAVLTIVHDSVIVDVPRATDVKAVQEVIALWKGKGGYAEPGTQGTPRVPEVSLRSEWGARVCRQDEQGRWK